MNAIKDLEERLHRDIMLTQHMGLLVKSYDEKGLVLSAPLERNLNHKQTAFGGSLNCLATLAGWGTVYLILKEMQQQAHIIIQDSEISYLKPVTQDFEAICPQPEEMILRKFKKMIQKKRIGRISLNCLIYQGGEIAVSFRGSYVATAYTQESSY
ncbi:MAG: thioesterase domain-containing protein [SAR324 cluster bacterium]|nr:thioesterase domain-containing protein [SAR324 cluster bacterium]